MRILYYFLDLQTHMYQWQKYHIVNELAEHGIKVDICSPLNYEGIEQANEDLISKIAEGTYDLFMTCLTETHIYRETICMIRKKGVPTLLFCPDNLTAPYNHKSIAKEFDLVWLTSKETEYLFRRWGVKTMFLPYAANPNFLKPIRREPEILRIGFIGTPHGSRIDRINTLLKKEIPITMHTNTCNLDNRLLKAPVEAYLSKFLYWMRYPIGRRLALAAVKDKLGHRDIIESSGYLEIKDSVPLSDLAAMNNAYALLLSFTDADSTGVLKHPVPIVNLRNFEVPMSGGIQITTYTEELASYFEDGKEIVLCKDDEEYTEKAKYYLREELFEKRQRMRESARMRAENEHTWYHRFKKIFDFLGLSK